MRNLKKVLSLVLAMAMAMSLAVTAGAAFADGDEISAEYATAVEFAAQTGILEGVGNNNYAPQDNLTRAQLATMTYRIATGDVEDDYTADFVGGATTFTDTAATAWYAGYVGYAADAGYLKGMGDGTYAPNAALTGYQALAAFLRTVGYNEAGHNFCGADWTVQVAKVANETGALEGIKGVDLNKAISREVAAQILYNIVFAQTVNYTPAFGYQDTFGNHSQAKDVFDIKSDKDGEVKATAPWGQPATKWFDKNDKVAVEIAIAPVVEYTTAVEECDLADDLGLGAKDGDVTTWYVNGFNAIDDGEKADKVINMRHTKTIGDQGTLTEVYEIDDEYWFVQVETWLGQITKTFDAKVDGNGHEIEAAKAKLNVFNCGERYHDMDAVVETDEFAKDDYVLANYSFMKDEDGKAYGFYLTETAPVATAKVTNVDRADKQTTIGGTVYDWSKHYHEGNPAITTTYEVFVDFYGNLIGLVEPAPAADVYTVLESGIWNTDGYGSHVDAKMLNLETEELEIVTLAKYVEGRHAVDNYIYFWDKVATEIHHIVKYVEGDDGFEFTKAGKEYKGYFIENGDPSMKVFQNGQKGAKFATADANTVYAIETECGVYDVVTGYENVPTMYSAGKIEVLDEDNDGFADLVYVDATSAIFAGEDVFAFVLPWTNDVGGGELEDGTEYDLVSNVVVGGEIVKVMVQDGKAGMFDRAYGPVTLKVDADGLVYAIADYDMSEKYVTEVAEDGKTVELNGQGYVVAETTDVWVIDFNHGGVDVEIGDFADFEKGDKVYFEVATGKILDLVVIVK